MHHYRTTLTRAAAGAYRYAEAVGQRLDEVRHELGKVQREAATAEARAQERAEALVAEQEARRNDSETHRQALAELKADHRHAVEALEKARDTAQAGQREAEKAAGEADHRATRAEARIEALEAELERLRTQDEKQDKRT